MKILLKNPGAQRPRNTSAISAKDRLAADIREYIGKDGYLPLEHDYRPTLNACAFDSRGMILLKRIGREHRERIDYEEMDEQMLTNVIIELFRYHVHCCYLYE